MARPTAFEPSRDITNQLFGGILLKLRGLSRDCDGVKLVNVCQECWSDLIVVQFINLKLYLYNHLTLAKKIILSMVTSKVVTATGSASRVDIHRGIEEELI